MLLSFAYLAFSAVLRLYYNRERSHRGLALLPPDSSGGEIKRRDRLGGLIHEYHRAVA